MGDEGRKPVKTRPLRRSDAACILHAHKHHARANLSISLLALRRELEETLCDGPTVAAIFG